MCTLQKSLNMQRLHCSHFTLLTSYNQGVVKYRYFMTPCSQHNTPHRPKPGSRKIPVFTTPCQKPSAGYTLQWCRGFGCSSTPPPQISDLGQLHPPMPLRAGFHCGSTAPLLRGTWLHAAEQLGSTVTRHSRYRGRGPHFLMMFHLPARARARNQTNPRVLACATN